MLRNRKIKRNWNNEDITLLVWLVCKLIQRLGLSHHSLLVPFLLFSKKNIGSLSQLSSQAPHGKSANSAGLALRRSSWSPTNGPSWSPNFSVKPSDVIRRLTGNWSPNASMKETLVRTRSSAQPSSAENTGTASSTLQSKRGPGPCRRIEGSYNMCWSWKALRSGLKSLSLWRGGPKTP
jgi:hypothetical protein